MKGTVVLQISNVTLCADHIWREAVLLLFTHIQHIVRTHDSRQSWLWSAERGDQNEKNHEAHT